MPSHTKKGKKGGETKLRTCNSPSFDSTQAFALTVGKQAPLAHDQNIRAYTR